MLNTPNKMYHRWHAEPLRMHSNTDTHTKWDMLICMCVYCLTVDSHSTGGSGQGKKINNTHTAHTHTNTILMQGWVFCFLFIKDQKQDTFTIMVVTHHIGVICNGIFFHTYIYHFYSILLGALFNFTI